MTEALVLSGIGALFGLLLAGAIGVSAAWGFGMTVIFSVSFAGRLGDGRGLWLHPGAVRSKAEPGCGDEPSLNGRRAGRCWPDQPMAKDVIRPGFAQIACALLQTSADLGRGQIRFRLQQHGCGGGHKRCGK